MEVEYAILRFKDACLMPSNRQARKQAVESQHNRRSFELCDKDGLIRIGFDIESCKIEMWHTVESCRDLHYMPYEKVCINEQEYFNLKKCFFGEFKENKSYLKKIGAIVD